MKKRYKVIALFGKSGAGKDTALKEICKDKDFNKIITCTTRPKRDYEIDGIDYHFLTPLEFYTKSKNREMIEETCFNDWYYGTNLNDLSEDKINIGVFNPGGIKNLLARNDVEVKVFYVRAPAKERLIRQLEREDDPDVDEVLRRYHADENDFWDLPFEYINLPNASIRDVDNALAQLVWNAPKDNN